MNRYPLYKQEARGALRKGIDYIADAVTTTLGPKGRNVAIDKKWGFPRVLHDGVSVAKEVRLPDPFENMGAKLIREASSRTNDKAGDGTTTSMLLAQSILKEADKYSKENPQTLKEEIDQAVNLVCAELEKIKTTIKTRDDIFKVAKISSANDEIGNIVADVLTKVGPRGVVNVQEGTTRDIEIIHSEGMELDRGYASPYFATDISRMEAEVKNARIFVTDKSIFDIEEIMPLLESLGEAKVRNFVLIAKTFEGQTLPILVNNHVKGVFNCIALKSPGFGDRTKAYLEDIAILTGATLIAEDTGRTLDTAKIDDCGMADIVWADKDNARIVGGKGDRGMINARIQQIEDELSRTNSAFDKEIIQGRLAKLTGGVAVISVGADTDVEMRERKERVIDAVNASKSALEQGIVPGGGIALLTASKILKGKTNGEHILIEALKSPFNKILDNAGEDIVKIRELIDMLPDTVKNKGYDVVTKKAGNLIEMGVIDPVKVTISALRNASSVATMILTTDVDISNVDIKTEEE